MGENPYTHIRRFRSHIFEVKIKIIKEEQTRRESASGVLTRSKTVGGEAFLRQ